MKDVGAVIVTYNSGAEIGSCLDAALTHVAEVAVVDNGSTDGTLEEVRKRPQVKLIVNPQNRGFAAAVNQGCFLLSTRLVLLLNPDAELLTGVESLAEACGRPEVGAAAGKLVDIAGKPQTGFMVRRLPTPLALSFEVLGLNRIWPGNPVNRRYRELDADPEQARDVEQPAGAFLMVRRDVWLSAGRLDERFHPLWFEDVDFCKRLHDKGLRVYYEPAAVARHSGGHSVGRISRESRVIYWYASLLRYSAKHFSLSGLFLVNSAIVLGSLLRMLVESVSQRNLRPFKIYGNVIRLAVVRLMTCRCRETRSMPVPARY